MARISARAAPPNGSSTLSCWKLLVVTQLLAADLQLTVIVCVSAVCYFLPMYFCLLLNLSYMSDSVVEDDVDVDVEDDDGQCKC